MTQMNNCFRKRILIAFVGFSRNQSRDKRLISNPNRIEIIEYVEFPFMVLHIINEPKIE